MTYMQEALTQARIAQDLGEIPVGAIIVQTGKIIARSHNLVETTNNPLAHAEMLAIQAACKVLKVNRLVDCDLYVTLEPCTMCAGAIAHARLRRIYFAAFDPKGGAVDHGVQFFNQPTCLHKPEIYGGLFELESSQLLKTFFIDKR